ncbi:MAG: glycosyltransferase [Polyangiaceae bacterium]|jgi:glycosyltransferase involved in cell wall biosynthesis
MTAEPPHTAPTVGANPTEDGPTVSVVLATYNRLDSLLRLLSCLTGQTLSPSRFEVVVVDDGSTIPVREHVTARRYPFPVSVLEQTNAGPSAARHRGVLQARGEVLVLVDDDMDLPPHFLEIHLRYHTSGRPTAVFGRYASDPNIGAKALFERYHGLKWDELSRAIASGRVKVDGTLLATGNASMRREDYLRVGGLDLSLPRAEDVALGLDLEEIGVKLVFSDAAYSVHLSDHSQPEKWRARALLHGRLEPRIARKHPGMAHADPWRFAFSLPLAGRVFCLPSLLAPSLGEKIATLTYEAAERADELGFERLAMRATGLVFGMEYFRGLRQEAGSIRGVAAGCLNFLRKAAASDRPVAGVPPWLARGVCALADGWDRPIDSAD